MCDEGTCDSCKTAATPAAPADDTQATETPVVEEAKEETPTPAAE